MLLVTLLPALAYAEGGDHGALGSTAGVAAVQLINWLGLFGVIAYFGGKKIKAMLVDRKKQVTADIDEAKALHEEASALLSKYESKLGKLDEEREEILADYRAMAETEKDRIVAEAKRQAEQIVADASATVEQEVNKAKTKLEGEMMVLAAKYAEEMLTEKLDNKAHRGLVDQYTKDLEAMVA